MRTLCITAITALTLLGAACGGDDSDERTTPDTGATSPAQEEKQEDGSDETGAELPDACDLLDVDEISAIVGREVGPGEPEPSADAGSSCRFELLTGMSTSTTYDDPAIPETSLGSVTISTARSSAAEFDEFEELVGDEAESVSEVGDDAYFWGQNILYVRVADRGLTVRIEADRANDAAIRAAVLQLAQLGVSKL